jgi:hypothetical protein
MLGNTYEEVKVEVMEQRMEQIQKKKRTQTMKKRPMICEREVTTAESI